MLFLRHIKFKRVCLGPILRAVSCGRLEVGRNYLCTSSRKCQRDRLTDPLAGASD